MQVSKLRYALINALQGQILGGALQPKKRPEMYNEKFTLQSIIV